MSRKLLIAGALSAGLILSPVAIAPAAMAATTLTSSQLADEGFTVAPNTTAWLGGQAHLDRTTAPAGADIAMHGTSPASVPAGQKLTLQRYVPADAKGDGTFHDVGASTEVNKDGTFTLRFTLDEVGVHGYRLGYTTNAPTGGEWSGIEFQITTTDKAAGSEPHGKPTQAVELTSAQLSEWGFPKKVNVSGWEPGTAHVSASTVTYGKPIVLTGKAPKYVKPGSIMSVKQFIATDTAGSGEMQAVRGASAKIRPDRSYKLVFTPYKGLHGYTAGVAGTEEWIGFQFQARAK